MRILANIGLNTVYQVAGRVVTALVGLISTRLITDHFGLSGYGEFQTVITYVTLYWMLTDFGFNAIAVREMAASSERDVKRYYGALTTIRVASGLIVTLAASLLLFILPYDTSLKVAILFGATTIFFQSLMGIGNALFQLRLTYQYQLLSNTLGSVTSLALFFVAIQLDLGVIGLVFAFVSSSLVMGVTNLMLARRLLPLTWSVDKSAISYLVKETLPFGVVLLFSLLILKVDAIMLSTLSLTSMANSNAIGIYNLAFKIFELTLIIPAFFMNTMYPLLIKRRLSGMIAFTKSVLLTGLALFTTAIFCMIAIHLLAPFIVSLLADSSEFKDAVTVLRILNVSLPFFFVTGLFMWLLVIFKRQKELMVIYGSALLFNVVLNLIYIPEFNYIAASITTGVTEMFILAMLVGYLFANRNAITREVTELSTNSST